MSSTLLPFLYQTRTLQRTIRCPSGLLRALHATPRPQQPRKPQTGRGAGNDESVPFEFGPDQGNVAASRRKRNPNSTITESEKRVFDEIFGDISKRRKQFGVPIPSDVESSVAEPLMGRPLRGAAEEEGQELDRESILAMYPPTLRRAAEIALGLREDTDGEGVAEEQHPVAAPGPEETEHAQRREEAKAAERAAQMALHRGEKARIQSLMQACKSDVALWQVLEDHVFSMVERLGIGSSKPAPKRKATKQEPAVAGGAAAAGPLGMELYGPLYSIHVLAALRHLDRGFATPSPLALNVLPRILELGMASYVLGVTTRFYNELMSIYWYRYGDGDSVMRLLKEMERAGLSGDGQTLRIVDAVAGTIEGLAGAEAEGSAFAGVLGSMQEFDSVVLEKLSGRKKWVLESMHERAGELPY